MSEKHFLLGIDVGTTNCKALLFDEKGTTVASARVKTITHNDKGQYYYLPDELWGIIIKVISEVLKVVEPSNISGVCITSMAESGLPLDKENNPTHHIIPYFDENSSPQAARLEELFGRKKLFELTGLNVSPIFSLAKILWIRDNYPEAFSRTRKWLCIPDYVNYKLTGKMVTDYSIASRTMVFDVFKRSWSTEILETVGLNTDLFPPVVPGGSLIGGVTREASGLTGLCEGIPVIVGGHDHYCGSLGAGLLLGNRLIDSSGSAESLHGLLGEEVENIEDFTGFSVGIYVDGKSYYAGGGFNCSGVSVDWIIERCASLKDWVSTQREREDLSYEEKDEIMNKSYQRPAGANGLLYLPHLRGSGFPDWNISSRGAFVGLRSSHRSPDLVRAVVEGVCFELKAILERLRKLIKHDITPVSTIGGGARNQPWLQLKADITGLHIEVPAVKEAAALGAALLAGVGTGIYTDLYEATKKTYQVDKRFIPNQENCEKYGRLFSINRKLYPVLKEINRDLTYFKED